MIGEGNWFKSFMVGSGDKKDPESAKRADVAPVVETEEEKRERAILAYRKQLEEIEESMQTTEMAPKSKERALFRRRLIEWKIKLLENNNQDSEDSILHNADFTKAWQKFIQEQEQQGFQAKTDDENITRVKMFDNLDTDPFIEVSGVTVEKDQDGQNVQARDTRFLLQYDKAQGALHRITEIPEGYEMQDVHPFGEFVILANKKHPHLGNLGREKFSREDFYLCKIDKNTSPSLQPVMKFSGGDYIAEYFSKKNRETVDSDGQFLDLILEECIRERVELSNKHDKKEHKRILGAVTKVIEEEKRRLGVTSIKTAMDWYSHYGITEEEQKQLRLVVDDDAKLLKEYGGAISMGGLAFSEDGSSIVRVVRTRTAHDAFATHIIPMVDFATGNTPKPEDVKIQGLVESLYDYAKQYGPYEDVERAVYKANKKLGNNDTI